MSYVRWCAGALVLLLSSTAIWAEPQVLRRKRPMPPLEQREPEVRQNGAGELPPPPPPAKASDPDSSWEMLEHPDENYESYTPQPLCEPPNIVPTTGLGPTVSDPGGGLFK